MTSLTPTDDDVLRVYETYLQCGKNQCHTAKKLGLSRETVQRRIKAYKARGLGKPPEKPRYRVKASSVPVETDALAEWRLEYATPQPAFITGPAHEFTTEPDNTFTFGASGDQHLGSKYERLDCMEGLYDRFAEVGCEVVFNTGNWIDGEARFNVHDLHTRGMDAQLAYLAHIFPRRSGLTTYAITGDDHEGWYSQREGVDIGRYAQQKFRDVGRADWIDLGYMEAPVALRNANSGKTAIISIVHPGGGSAYALSYSIQKIIESLDGGEKPAVGIYGHYHKLWFGNIRNVWCIQTGCTQDQTPFMRKKKIEAHVGGTLVKLTQDPATGAILRCQVEIIRFFNRGYASNRWSHHGGVQQIDRVLTGIAT